MDLLIVAGGVLVLNLAYLLYLDNVNRRHAKQIDKLTTKIVAPHTVTAYEPAPDTKLVPGGVTIQQNDIPLAEANPEDIMHALAVEAGIEEK